MRRGVRLEDPTQRRRTVTTLPDELRVRGAQVLSSFRERVGIALGNGAGPTTGSVHGVSRDLRGDSARVAAAARTRLAGGVLPGLRDVEQQYTWGAVSDRWAALYRRLARVRDAVPATPHEEDAAADAAMLREASTR